MPWKISNKRSECSGYAVVDDKNKVVGCHPTRAAALAQQRALYASEANKNMDEGSRERRGKRKHELKKMSVVENHPECSGGFAVVSDDNGELQGCYKTRAAAEQAISQYEQDHQNEDPNDMQNIWGGAFSPKI